MRMRKWEMYLDRYFGIYIVRPQGDKDNFSPLLFRLVQRIDAENLKDLLNDYEYKSIKYEKILDMLLVSE
jgi:hypothetical protein